MSCENKKAIFVDLDNTLADSIGAQLKLLKSRFDITKTKEDIKKFDLETELDISSASIMELFRDVWRENEFMPLENPAIPKIMQNISKSYYITILTASIGTSPQIMGWLNRNRIPYTSFIQTFSVNGKLKFGLLTKDINIFIDDDAEMIKTAAGLNNKGILIRKPWNTQIKENENPNITVVNDWNEIPNILRI